MKISTYKLITLSLIPMSILSFAQVAIGKTAVSSNSVSLEFGTGNKGIVVPWVTQASAVSFTTDASVKKGGVIVLDTQDKKVKVSKGDGTWSDLTRHTNELVTAGNTTIDTSLQDNPNFPEKPNARAVIGANASMDTTPGILILADHNKAMVLPKMASPHLNIKNPTPGMLAYDTVKRQLAVYNGTVWTFWKP